MSTFTDVSAPPAAFFGIRLGVLVALILSFRLHVRRARCRGFTGDGALHPGVAVLQALLRGGALRGGKPCCTCSRALTIPTCSVPGTQLAPMRSVLWQVLFHQPLLGPGTHLVSVVILAAAFLVATQLSNIWNVLILIGSTAGRGREGGGWLSGVRDAGGIG